MIKITENTFKELSKFWSENEIAEFIGNEQLFIEKDNEIWEIAIPSEKMGYKIIKCDGHKVALNIVKYFNNRHPRRQAFIFRMVK